MFGAEIYKIFDYYVLVDRTVLYIGLSWTVLDIKDGNLKCVLGLFFNLSRYKQQLKQAKQESASDTEMSSRLVTLLKL